MKRLTINRPFLLVLCGTMGIVAPLSAQSCFTEGFNAAGIPPGWTVENLLGSGWDAATSGFYNFPQEGTGNAYVPAAGSAGANNWLFTPGIAMVGGQTYTVTAQVNFANTGSGAEQAQFIPYLTSAATSTSVVLTGTPVNCFACGGGYSLQTQTFTAPSTGTYYVAFRVAAPSFGGVTVHLDAVEVAGCVASCTPTVSSFPDITDFDGETSLSSSFCTSTYTFTSSNWGNSGSGTTDWRARTGTTPSTGTGPSQDHTPPCGGNYAYLESTTCSGSVGELVSACYDFSSLSSPVVQFWAHMYGAAMGTLALQASTDGGTSWSADLWSLSGDQGNGWLFQSVDLSAYAGVTGVQLRFTGTLGNATSDMALDDIGVGESGSFALAGLNGTYDVGGGNNDYATPQAAADALMALGVTGPVTMNIFPGTYGQLDLCEIPGASAANLVTFTSSTNQSTDVTLEHASTGTADNFVVRFRGTDYVRLDALTLRNTATGGNWRRAVVIDGDASFLTIANSTLRNTPAGTALSGDYALVYVLTPSAAVKSDLSFLGNLFDGGNTGITTAGTVSADNLNIRIVRNEFRNQTRYAASLSNIDGYEVLGNRAFFTSTATASVGGFVLSSTDNGIAANNMLVEQGTANNYTGFLVQGSSSNTELIYNSVNVNNADALSAGIRVFGSASDARVRNNSLTMWGGGIPFRYNTGDVSIADYNNLFTTGSVLVEADASTNYANLAAWQGTGFGANSISAAPGYVSATDLHIGSSASPLVDAAQALPGIMDVDIDGDLRNPDIGADEFIAPLPVELLGIHAHPVGPRAVEVTWTVAREEGFANYELQRATPGTGFVPLSTIAGQNATQRTTYRYSDRNTPSGRLHYRLRLVDADGSAQYSRVVEVFIGEETALQVYPNPTTGVVHVAAAGDALQHIQVLNSLGQVVHRAALSGEMAQLDLRHLAAGVYSLVVQTARHTQHVRMVLED